MIELLTGIPALILSSWALIYANRSAREAKRSAAAAERSSSATEEVARYEAERRHEERKPRIKAIFHRAQPSNNYHPVVLLTHDGGADCDEVQVTLEKPGDYPSAIAGFSHIAPPWRFGPFKSGDEKGITVQNPRSEGGKVIIRCQCTANTESWDIRISLEIPRERKAYVL